MKEERPVLCPVGGFELAFQGFEAQAKGHGVREAFGLLATIRRPTSDTRWASGSEGLASPPI